MRDQSIFVGAGCVMFVVWLAVVAAVTYVALHFVSKFW